LSLYIVLIAVLIYSAAQLQKCLINLLTYLLTYLHVSTRRRLIRTKYMSNTWHAVPVLCYLWNSSL